MFRKTAKRTLPFFPPAVTRAEGWWFFPWGTAWPWGCQIKWYLPAYPIQR